MFDLNPVAFPFNNPKGNPFFYSKNDAVLRPGTGTDVGKTVRAVNDGMRYGRLSGMRRRSPETAGNLPARLYSWPGVQRRGFEI